MAYILLAFVAISTAAHLAHYRTTDALKARIKALEAHTSERSERLRDRANAIMDKRDRR